MRWLLLCLALTACKKSPQPTLPMMDDMAKLPAGDNVETDQSILFHTLVKYPGHASQVLGFYGPEMEKRGAARQGDGFSDGNIEHVGGFGRDGSASVKDAARPGIWMSVFETAADTRVDIWENVPKTR
ncbi:MAG TPA: hypothetical protein VLW85_10730 [Myxococcales bacterium]|nr:hypothetical protein [Myxococcales bacterium]